MYGEQFAENLNASDGECGDIPCVMEYKRRKCLEPVSDETNATAINNVKAVSVVFIRFVVKAARERNVVKIMIARKV